MQRFLFSFPRGAAGIGLLLARFMSGLDLLIQAAQGRPVAASFLLGAVLCGGGILLILGLWTRVISVLIALGSVLYLAFHCAPWWHGILLGTLSLTLAVLGPGAWSLDVKRAGWKRIEIPKG